MASTVVLPSLHIQTTLFDPKHVETPPSFGHDLAELRSGFNGGFKALPLDPLTQKQLRMFKESRELRFKEESGHITNSPLPLSSKKGIRRTISSCDLAQLSAFSLPPSEMKSAPYKSKDDHTWDSAEEEQQQESFDDIFFECLHNLMDSVISQRLSKKRAMSIMTAAFKCSPVKDRIAPKVPQIITDLLCKEETEGGLSNSPRYARSSCKNDSECDPTPLQSKTNFETKKKLNFAHE